MNLYKTILVKWEEKWQKVEMISLHYLNTDRDNKMA